MDGGKMSDMINPFTNLQTVSMKFNDCPRCHGGIMSFIHDETRIDPYRIICKKCGCTAGGKTWRETLQKWNSGNIDETIEPD